MSRLISVISAIPLQDYKLSLVFSTGEQGIFDMRPYLEKGIFTQLKDILLFQNLKIMYRTVTWCDGELDISPDTLYFHATKFPSN